MRAAHFLGCSALAAVLLTSCAREPRHSTFLLQGTSFATLESSVTGLGVEILGQESGTSLTAHHGERSVGVQFAGDEGMRDSVLEQCEQAMRAELVEFGLRLSGQGHTGEGLKGFTLDYDGDGLRGSIRFYSTVTGSGFVLIRGVAEEYLDA